MEVQVALIQTHKKRPGGVDRALGEPTHGGAGRRVDYTQG